jgi:uncharacterized protein involved in exopolysaccharide biosynthesis
MTLTTDKSLPDDYELSLLQLGAMLFRSRRRIARWAFLGGMVAALSVITKPALYSATLSFVPQGGDAARSSLASLAGQLGLSTSSGPQTQSPDFYVGLIKSRELLGRIANDTFTFAEDSGKRVTFMEQFNVAKGPADRREEDAVRLLLKLVRPSVNKTTGVVQVSVVTKWPSVSLAIARNVLSGVNDFNVRTRQGQATSERKFVESQLEVRRADFEIAQTRLLKFLTANRGVLLPELSFARDNLQRDLSMRQEVYTALLQAYDDAKIREVRDTPTISVIESPRVSTYPEPRGRVKTGLLGFVVGAMFGIGMTLVGAALRRRSDLGDPDASALIDWINRLIGKVLGRFGRPTTT